MIQAAEIAVLDKSSPRVSPAEVELRFTPEFLTCARLTQKESVVLAVSKGDPRSDCSTAVRVNQYAVLRTDTDAI